MNDWAFCTRLEKLNIAHVSAAMLAARSSSITVKNDIELSTSSGVLSAASPC
jgi:cytochrome c biogenesis protein ResB